MTLRQAVELIIEQNKSLKYVPTYFIRITADKDDFQLSEAIRGLILKPELLEDLEKKINKYGSILTIEDLVVFKDDHFSFADDVVMEAKKRSESFNWFRSTDNNWVIKFLK